MRRRRCSFCGLNAHGTRNGLTRCARRALALVVALIRAGALPDDALDLVESDRYPYSFRPGRARA